jgi:hypothetical protein
MGIALLLFTNFDFYWSAFPVTFLIILITINSSTHQHFRINMIFLIVLILGHLLIVLFIGGRMLEWGIFENLLYKYPFVKQPSGYPSVTEFLAQHGLAKANSLILYISGALVLGGSLGLIAMNFQVKTSITDLSVYNSEHNLLKNRGLISLGTVKK